MIRKAERRLSQWYMRVSLRRKKESPPSPVAYGKKRGKSYAKNSPVGLPYYQIEVPYTQVLRCCACARPYIVRIFF